MISLIRTEAEFKKLLEGFSDQKIKKMQEHVDIYPFPVLLLQEYSRRFHPADTKKQVMLITRQLTKQKIKQRKLLKEIRSTVKKMGDYTISQSGLRDLSKKAIDGIHQKSRGTVSSLQKMTDDLEVINKKIIQYENKLKNFQKK